MNYLLLAFMLTAATPPFEVQTLDGRTIVGQLTEISADRMTVDSEAGPVTLEADQVMMIAPREKPSQDQSDTGWTVALVDGSTILAQQYTVNRSRATIVMADGETLETPIDAIQSVSVRPMPNELQSEWTRLTQRRSDGDLLVVRSDPNFDYHEGVLHDVSDEAVQFEFDGEMLPVKRSKILGFVYRHGGEEELPAAVCLIKDATGSEWSVRSLNLPSPSGRGAGGEGQEEEKLQWVTSSGLDVSQSLDRIVQIDFSGGKVVYLSDLKADSVRWTPYFNVGKQPPTVEQFYAPRYDRGFPSGPLQLGGVPYRKGLALHSRTEIIYRLPDRFGRFHAMAGIADSVRPGGSVRLVIRGDGRDLFDAVLTGSDDPRPIDLDLTGVRRLTIVAEYSNGLATGDTLLLCNARLGK